MQQRVSYFDNAKFILITFVVFGHFIRSYIEHNDIILTVYKFIYSFHMPAFILIAGFFSKKVYQKGYLKKMAIKFLLPYFIFQVVYFIYYYLIGKESEASQFDLFNPYWSLWFLLSLFFWNLLLYFFAKLNKWVAISLSISLSLVIGYFDFIDNYLSLSRTFVFFPIFLIGYYLKLEHFQRIVSRPIRIVSMILLIIVFVSFYYISFHYEWLYGSKPYSFFTDEPIEAIWTRLGVYFLIAFTTLCFLTLIPTRKTFFTHWGKRTFYVYLLHGFIIQAFRVSELENWLTHFDSLALFAIISILVTFLLSSNIVQKVSQPLIDLRIQSFSK